MDNATDPLDIGWQAGLGSVVDMENHSL